MKTLVLCFLFVLPLLILDQIVKSRKKKRRAAVRHIEDQEFFQAFAEMFPGRDAAAVAAARRFVAQEFGLPATLLAASDYLQEICNAYSPVVQGNLALGDLEDALDDTNHLELPPNPTLAQYINAYIANREASRRD